MISDKSFQRHQVVPEDIIDRVDGTEREAHSCHHGNFQVHNFYFIRHYMNFLLAEDIPSVRMDHLETEETKSKEFHTCSSITGQKSH